MESPCEPDKGDRDERPRAHPPPTPRARPRAAARRRSLRRRRRARPRRRSRSAPRGDADDRRRGRPDARAHRRPLLHGQLAAPPVDRARRRRGNAVRPLRTRAHHGRQARPSSAHRLLAVRCTRCLRQQRLSLPRTSVHRRQGPLLVGDGRARRLSGPDEAHPRQGAGTAALGADDAALLPRRERQPGRRHLHAGVPGDRLARGERARVARFDFVLDL